MSVEKARACYTGKNGEKKLNCAQAVAAAFQEALALSPEDVAGLAHCGGGAAPGGVCGAFHAAATILNKEASQDLPACEAQFAAAAGSTKCREIRAKRQLSCLGCVEKAAEFLERIRK